MDIQEGPTDCLYREVSNAERANICQKFNYLKTALRGQYLHRVRLENVTKDAQGICETIQTSIQSKYL